MKQKSGILMLFVSIVIFCAAITALFLVLQTVSDNNNSDNSNNNSEDNNNNDSDDNDNEDPDTNQIEFKGGDPREYDYAVITNEDTIRLYTKLGEELDINLSRQQWNNLQWSEDGMLISTLGKFNTNNQNTDLTIYDFETGEWNKVTNYLNTPNGVLSYLWNGSNLIFFNQGVNPDNWLHRYNYDAQVEIRKIERIDGTIIGKSIDNEYLVYRMNNDDIKVFDFQGDEIFDFTKITDENNKDFDDIDKVVFGGDSKTIFFTTKEEQTSNLYQITIGDLSARKINLGYELIPVCSINENVFLGYSIDKNFNEITIITYNANQERDNIIAKKDFESEIIKEETFKCFNTNDLVFSVLDGTETSWYKLGDEADLIEVSFLKNSLEVDVK